MITLAYILTLLIGFSLGVTGSGGAILTMPLLVYLFGIAPPLATTYTLLIIGVLSMIGTVKNFFQGLIHFRAVALLGSSSMMTIYVVRKFIVPLIPKQALTAGNFSLGYSDLSMSMFALFMLISAYFMFQHKPQIRHTPIAKGRQVCLFALYGVATGIITGFLGIGGGFIIIPALVLLLNMPMKEAVGTSLTIIMLNSFIGFLATAIHYTVDWQFLLSVIVISSFGLVIGLVYCRHLQNEQLKKIFGCIVLAIGVGILINEIIAY